VRGRLVVVEGLDFSGKTTAARLLLEELGERGTPAVYNSAKERRLRAWSKRLSRSSRLPAFVADLLFLAAVLYDTARIAARMREGVTVVQDRYYASYVWNQLAIRDRRGRPRRGLLRLYHLLRPLFLDPDVLIFCECSAETLRRRYAEASTQPGSLSPNDRSVFEDGVLSDHAEAFERALAGFPNVRRCRNDAEIAALRTELAPVVAILAR
jgi:thymidylate kinase